MTGHDLLTYLFEDGNGFKETAGKGVTLKITAVITDVFQHMFSILTSNLAGLKCVLREPKTLKFSTYLRTY